MIILILLENIYMTFPQNNISAITLATTLGSVFSFKLNKKVFLVLITLSSKVRGNHVNILLAVPIFLLDCFFKYIKIIH